jgi:hypothetical protein
LVVIVGQRSDPVASEEKQESGLVRVDNDQRRARERVSEEEGERVIVMGWWRMSRCSSGGGGRACVVVQVRERHWQRRVVKGPQEELMEEELLEEKMAKEERICRLERRGRSEWLDRKRVTNTESECDQEEEKMMIVMAKGSEEGRKEVNGMKVNDDDDV